MATGLDAGFRLGPWDVRPMLGTLTGPEGTLRLEPKVMNVLVCLAEFDGEVVTHEQFITRVWRGRVVSDEVLSRCISLLRTSLGDDPRGPRFIQTLPKIGYRLLTRVQPLPASPAQAAETPQPIAVLVAETPVETIGVAEPLAAAPDTVAGAARLPVGTRLVLALGILGVLVAIAVYLYRDYHAPPVTPSVAGPLTIAVLPFVNRSDDKDNEYFSDGLTEELIDRLANVPELQVVASTSAFALKDHREDVRQIGQRLGVRYLIEGSVRRENGRVRINAQLVDAERGFHLWSKPFDTGLSDIFAVQDSIANSIVTELLPRLTGKDARQIATAQPTKVIAAYELLLQGRYHLKRREEAPIRRSIELFEQAIALDPAFADAYRELARAYVLLPYYSYEDLEEMSQLAVSTIARGTAVDPGFAASAQDVLAFVHRSRWEWIEADEGFRLALLATPRDPSVHQWYSQLLAQVGNARLSLHHALEARKLDVLSPVVNDRLAVAYMWVDEDAKARRQFELADELGMGPTANPDAYVVLLLRQGEYDKARDLLIDLQKLFARATEWIDPFIAAMRDPARRPAARAAVAKAARERSISPQYLFGAWVFLGDADAAMDVAFDLLHEPAEFDVEFLYARETSILRSHPRFGELVTAIGLDRYWDRNGWPSMCARNGARIECH